MRLIIYRVANADAKEFVEFWSARYTGYDDEFYEANTGRELTEERILALFEWKNGTPLSGPKRNSVLRNFVARRDELPRAADESASDLLARFGEGGVIWRIFWLHCWQPARFPIYDQHVHRAMRFIEKGGGNSREGRGQAKRLSVRLHAVSRAVRGHVPQGGRQGAVGLRKIYWREHFSARSAAITRRDSLGTAGSARIRARRAVFL
jgi:hypothetical protein